MTARASRPDDREAAAISEEASLTAARVDLAAIRANVRSLKRHAGAALLQVVVKANAYGHGAVPVARAAVDAGADWLGVYAPSEGQELRHAGISAPVLVFGPFTADQANAMTALGLTPTTTSLEAAALIQHSAGSRSIGVHLKLDSGLNRSGIAAEDAVAFARALQQFPAVRLEGVYTHFASADEADKTLTHGQLATFLTAVQAMRSAGFPLGIRHAANSAATIDLPESHLDMVRCGIATYGIYPSSDVSRAVPLRPALSLVSTLTRVHPVPAGAGIGYGHDHLCKRASVIGLAPIGYGDGLLRSLGNGRGRVLVRGQVAQIVGRVSMDQVTIDLSGVDGARPGDQVTLIGRNGDAVQTAEELGAQAGTIGYDVVTKLLPRIPRVHIDRAGPGE
jgi:alanine racemase